MEDKVVVILKGFYRIIEGGRLMLLHSLRERIIITIITSILSTIATKIYYWNSMEPSRVWFIFCLIMILLMTYGLLASYIIERIAAIFDYQVVKILIRVLLYLIAGTLPFIGSPILIVSIITAIIYVLVDALYPQSKS